MRTITTIMIFLFTLAAVGQGNEKTRLKKRKLGNLVTTKSMVLVFPTEMQGSELGILIEIKKEPTYIKEFNAVVASNEYDTLKFRLKLYDIKDAYPDKCIFNKEYSVIRAKKGELLSFDLSEEKIVVNNDFFVSLEWISDQSGKELSFTGGMFGQPAMTRDPGNHKWTKLSDYPNVGFVIGVEY